MGTSSTSTATTNRTEIDSVIQAIRDLAKPESINVPGGAPAVVIPAGKTVVPLGPLRTDEEAWQLRRIRGAAAMTKPDSFVAHARRFGDPERTVLFATRESIKAVYDYHYGASSPRVGAVAGEEEPVVVSLPSAQHCDHQAVYQWPFSEAWKAWTKAWSRSLSSVELAEVLEDRAADILNPASPSVFASTVDAVNLLGLTLGSASDLLAVAKEFRVSVKRDIAAAHNTDTGEVMLEYSETHSGAQGKRGVTVPTGLLLAIPVHEDGSAFQVVVRLRYSIQDARVTWQLKAHGVDDVVRVATEHQVQSIAEQLPELPLFWGAPER